MSKFITKIVFIYGTEGVASFCKKKKCNLKRNLNNALHKKKRQGSPTLPLVATMQKFLGGRPAPPHACGCTFCTCRSLLERALSESDSTRLSPHVVGDDTAANIHRTHISWKARSY